MHKSTSKNVNVPVDTFLKYVAALSQKLNVTEKELTQLANVNIKRKLLLRKIKQPSVNIPSKYIVRNKHVVGKIEEGKEMTLDYFDISYLKENNIQYQLPENISCPGQGIEMTVLAEYVSSDDEAENDA